MDRRLILVVAAAMVLALPLGGCRAFRQPDVPLPVGTCVRASDEGTPVVPCSEPHTHKVIAIAPRPEACPVETVMWSQPADPDDGTTTTCFALHRVTE